MICDDLRMHWAGIFLFLLVLMLLLVMVVIGRAIDVSHCCLCAHANSERHRGGKNKKPFLIVGHKSSVVAVVSAATVCAMQTARLPLQRTVRDPNAFGVR